MKAPKGDAGKCYFYGHWVGWIKPQRAKWYSPKAAYWVAYDWQGRWVGSAWTREAAQERLLTARTAERIG